MRILPLEVRCADGVVLRGTRFVPEQDVGATVIVNPAIFVRERYYAISVERRIKHPAVLVICEAARDKIFA